MTMYIVTATVCSFPKELNTSRQVPTFFLDSDVQGIVSIEHAKQIANEVIDPLGLCDIVDIFVTED